MEKRRINYGSCALWEMDTLCQIGVDDSRTVPSGGSSSSVGRIIMRESREGANDSPLGPIHGSQLSSVEFVQDYVQLRFDGPCLTAITWPVVTVGQQRFRLETPGYRDALC